MLIANNFSIIQYLEKVSKKLKIPEKEIIKCSQAKTAAGFKTENIMSKKYLLKSSKIIAYNYIYLGKKDFNHASKS